MALNDLTGQTEVKVLGGSRFSVERPPRETLSVHVWLSSLLLAPLPSFPVLLHL